MRHVFLPKGGARCDDVGTRLFNDPELDDGVDSRLLRPVLRTGGVEHLSIGESRGNFKKAVEY